MKQYGSFDEWKLDQTSDNQQLIEALTKVVLEICPELEQTVKWGQGCFLYHGQHKIYIHAAEDYIQLGFYEGSSLDDPNQLLNGKGKFIRFAIIRSFDDINQELFKPLIQQVLK